MTNSDTSSQSNSPVANQNAKSINLQGVAAFVGLVELLATELGVSPGRIEGSLPNGPNNFEDLIGEIVVNNQGFQRNLYLLAKPGSPLNLRFTSSWHSGQATGAVEAHFYLTATVEQILPQGRALARYCEDAFALLDTMVTLGHSGKLSGMSLSTSEIEAFEQEQQGKLTGNFAAKKINP